MPEMKTQTINGVTYEIVDQVVRASLEAHMNDQTNSHNVTAEQVGAVGPNHGNHVPTTQTADNATFLRNDNTWQKVTPANIGARPDTWMPTAADVGAAESSHNHGASNITSGILPLARGGTNTGFTNMPSYAIINKAATQESLWYTATGNGAFYATATNGAPKFGTLPFEQGGTNATSRLGAAKSLTNEAVSAPNYVVSLTNSWGKFGYSTLQQLRNASGLGNTTGALPIANGGTGKTKPADALAALGGASITSVWTNSSPTSQFNAQSISKTLSSYDAVLIQARTHIGDYEYGPTETSLIVRVGGSGMIVDASESGSYLVSRKVTVTTSKITFASAKYPATYAATSLTEGNRNLVPTYIYGINW